MTSPDKTTQKNHLKRENWIQILTTASLPFDIIWKDDFWHFLTQFFIRLHTGTFQTVILFLESIYLVPYQISSLHRNSLNLIWYFLNSRLLEYFETRSLLHLTGLKNPILKSYSPFNVTWWNITIQNCCQVHSTQRAMNSYCHNHHHLHFQELLQSNLAYELW